MSILTPNRILEKGDEYKDNGTWKPVPDKDFGMQVMFTKYAAVRRPKEPDGNITLTPVQQQGSQTVRQESAKLPIAGSTPAPASPPPLVQPSPLLKPKPLAQTYDKAKPKVLPTVVSSKAHKLAKAEAAKARLLKSVMPTKKDEISIAYPPRIGGAVPVWIGRNGTFKATAIRMSMAGDGLIQIRPEGKRGLAKNALIEFPAEIIPQVIDWLIRHEPPATPTPTT